MSRNSRQSNEIVRVHLYDLWPFTNISARVAVLNSKFYGPPSNVYTFTTDEGGQYDRGSRYSITERRAPELIPVLDSQPAGDVSHKPGCHYFSPGPQLSSQPLRGLLPVSLLGKQRHDGCEQFA